ncbi:hypothetical protein [Streptomyces chrestomyceticus]|uniref:Secreted protein n=1 Tax=Streptomyces chrestomyceticus TaxID=68185 RepID=A0ABU7X665_9ACTN
MDQGWAALLGAAFGALFGGGAAITAAWLGRSGMKMQAQAMIRQASWQADAAHEQWRRQVLRDACIEYVEAARLDVHATRRYHGLVMFNQQGMPRDPEQIFQRYHARGMRLQRAALVLELEGSHEVREATQKVLDAARAIPPLNERLRDNYPEAQEKTQHMWEAIDEFVRVARTHLTGG